MVHKEAIAQHDGAILLLVPSVAEPLQYFMRTMAESVVHVPFGTQEENRKFLM